jgi:DNA end-binding protein Ku
MRYTWTGTIAMGMVVIPVKLANAVSEDKSPLHRYHVKDGGAVKQRTFCAVDGEEITDWNDITRGYPAADGTVVLLTKDDFDQMYGERSKVLEIRQFIDVSGLPPAAHESTYVIKPEAAGAKAYALLAYALRESGKAAEVSVMIASREATGYLRADSEGYIWLERLEYEANVRKPDFAAPNPVLTAAEMKMADNLVKEMSGAFDWASHTDKTMERLQEVIAAKLAAGQVTGTPAAPLAPVLDLTAALQASVAKAKADKAPVPRTRAPRARKAAGA